MFTIYLITNKTNGKRYVGLTSRSIRERWLEHLSGARCGLDTYIYRAIRKYGSESFTITTLDTSEDTDVASWREMFWISAFETSNRDKGYNSDEGGSGYYHPTVDVLEKRSNSIKKRYADGLAVWCTRFDITEQTVADLYSQGFSQRQIAKQLGVSKRTVAVRLETAKVPQRTVRDYKITITDETRKKMREAKLADPLTAERCRKMTRERLERRANK